MVFVVMTVIFDFVVVVAYTVCMEFVSTSLLYFIVALMYVSEKDSVILT